VSRFTDHLGILQVYDKAGMPVVVEGRTVWDLTSALPYDVGAEGSGERITVPAGFRTDLGSIPQAAWSFGFSPSDRGSNAYVLHDFLYATGGSCAWRGQLKRTRKQAYRRSEADAILVEALKALGVPAWRRALIWAAVRAFGAPGWGSA